MIVDVGSGKTTDAGFIILDEGSSSSTRYRGFLSIKPVDGWMPLNIGQAFYIENRAKTQTYEGRYIRMNMFNLNQVMTYNYIIFYHFD